MTRWAAYNSAKESTINKIESSLKLKHLASSLPNAIAKDKKFCEKMHRTLIDSLIASIREFSEEVEEQVKLKPGLDGLDKIAQGHQNQSEKGRAWRTDRIPINNQAPRDRYLVKNASQNLQGNAVDPLDGCVTELEAKVKEFSDEIADNANKIDRFMERVTVTEYHSDP